jgi:hypothetical protein
LSEIDPHAVADHHQLALSGVPVCPGRLDLLRFGQVALDEGAFKTVAALPVTGDFGIVGERDVELLAVLGAVPRDLTRCQVVVAIGLVAHSPEPTTPQHTISHRRFSSY